MNKYDPAMRDVAGEASIFVISLTVISEMLALIAAVLFKLINPNLLIICSALTGIFIFFMFMQFQKNEDNKS